MAATKKPSGLSISRNGMKFTFTWKITDKDHDAGQQLQYKTNLGKSWTSITVGKKTTSKTRTFTAASYYPTTKNQLTSVSFRIRGKRKKYTEGSGKNKKTKTPGWSGWAKKTFSISSPMKPELSTELNESNQSTFSWELKNDITSTRILRDFVYESIRIRDCSETNGSKLKWDSSQPGWRSGTASASSGTAEGSQSFTEDSEILATGSYTRWFRVKARGTSGDSEWVYQKHVYAKPYKATVNSNKAAVSNTDITVTTKWTAEANTARPIDQTVVEYLIAVPAEGRTVPAGATFTEIATSKDTAGKDGITATIGTTLEKDQCLWTRVKTKHDSNETNSDPKLVLSGDLKDPTGLSVSTNIATYRATVTANNESAVPDSRLAVIFRKKGEKDRVIGIIPHGESGVTVQCPSWSSGDEISFGVYAFQGSAASSTKSGVTEYAITANMRSESIFIGGSVPSEPKNVAVERSDEQGEVILTWSWSWQEADSAEISWSQNPNSWESTDEPSRYLISNLNAAKWRVSGLEMGTTWYFRIRLAVVSGEEVSYGPYSRTVSADLSSAPEVPLLVLSEPVITKNGRVTASWVYFSTDDTPQTYAEICEVTVNGSTITYGTVIAHANGEQYAVIDAAEVGWRTGETHNLCVRVVSESGLQSGWSDPTSVLVAEELACSITQTSLAENHSTITDYNPSTTVTLIRGTEAVEVNPEQFGIAMGFTAGNYFFHAVEGTWSYVTDTETDIVGYGKVGTLRTVQPVEIDPAEYGISSDGTEDEIVKITLAIDPDVVTETALTVMPMTVTAEGAGEGGTTTFIIERAEEYHVVRPDESEIDGYRNETIFIARQTGEGQISIGIDDLIGALDDGAKYRLIAIAEDGLGQTAEDSIDFTVRWAHQAGIPSGSEEKDGLAAIIIPVAPSEYASGDYCDIYRLSSDRPELIVRNGSFGEVYVDPYPAVGEDRGHRIVHRTSNGDYITQYNQPAWIDITNEVVIDEYSIIIDFDGWRAILPYDIGLSSRWSKDFKLTSYLGGSQQGDWNPAVTRTANYTAVLLADEDREMIEIVRRLADYSGICHIRTPEGSSYAANVEVAESKTHNEWDKVSFTLTVTRVDPESLEGMTYKEWIE